MLEEVRDAAKEQEKSEDWPYKDWPLEQVQRLYSYTVQMLEDSGGAIRDEWDELTARLARIVLSERGQAKFVEDWIRLQSHRGGK